MRRRLLLAALATLSVVVLVPARADAPNVTGWWARHRITPPNPGLPVTTTTEVQTPATVPEGGLYVAGEHMTVPEDAAPDPDPQRTGISALRFFVGERVALGDLVLTFHKENGVKRAEGVVALQACPSTIVWTPEEGGPITSAPPSDCSTGLAFGSGGAEDDGVRIPVGGLVRNGELNIVLMPQPGSAFQAVFAKPGPESIEVTRFPPPPDDPTTTTSTLLPTTTVPTTLPPRRAPDPISEILVTTPPTTTAVALPKPPASGPSRRVMPPSRPIGTSPPGLSGWQQALAAGVLAALAALYLVLLRGGPLPVRKPAAETGPPARGIGRFARPRTGPNPRL